MIMESPVRICLFKSAGYFILLSSLCLIVFTVNILTELPSHVKLCMISSHSFVCTKHSTSNISKVFTVTEFI